MRPNERRPRAAGFTLLEVLVALIIFALTFGVLAQIMQTGLRQSTTATASSTATLLARSQLARVGVELPLEAGESAGETADGLRWHTLVELAEPPTEEQSFVPYLVEVTVAWGSGPAEQVTLTTLRLGAPPQ
ncbi:MAG TPA: type II secretion system protein [Geminicoccaceae bacterium]|nr:type II secretion system protein [Geminicoccaceae bacterium]